MNANKNNKYPSNINYLGLSTEELSKLEHLAPAKVKPNDYVISNLQELLNNNIKYYKVINMLDHATYCIIQDVTDKEANPIEVSLLSIRKVTCRKTIKMIKLLYE